MTIDADSTIVEVYGHHKQGAAYGYTHTLGYHPLLATRADTGEVLHARQRAGRANTARGMTRFVDELIARVRRAGATGELTIRMDSGFWSAKTIKTLRRHQVHYSITVGQTKPVRHAIAAIGEQAWVDIAYPDTGVAQVAETRYKGDRLIVRRVRHLSDQGQLFPTWDYTPSSPTVSAPSCGWTPTIAATPPSSCASVTSKPALAYGTARQGGLPPTPPGWPDPNAERCSLLSAPRPTAGALRISQLDTSGR